MPHTTLRSFFPSQSCNKTQHLTVAFFTRPYSQKPICYFRLYQRLCHWHVRRFSPFLCHYHSKRSFHNHNHIVFVPHLHTPLISITLIMPKRPRGSGSDFVCHVCGISFFGQRSLSVHYSMSEQCASSWLAPPEQVELTTLPSNAAPMFDQCFTLDGNGNPTNETSLTALDDDSGDPYQPMDDGDDFPPPSDDGDESPPDSPLSPPPTEETYDPSSPLFDTDPPSEADKKEISDAAVPEAAAGVHGIH
jgi:hypothetical protein